MAHDYDAIIIGAGIIGAATAFEMAKSGLRTLNVDKLPAAGYGSTSNSCAIIRVHYSTLDGTAFAFEGYYYWKDWANYLGASDESGHAEFIECGCLVMQTEHNGHLKRHTSLCDELNIPYEIWDRSRITERLPVYDLKRHFPPKRIGDDGFAEPTGGDVESAVYFPTAGYISDPQLATHNLQRAAEAHGAEFRFNCEVADILKSQGRVSGIALSNGTEISAPVVVNVAGPHSCVINVMAGADADMKITTRALRQEVVHVPSPPNFDFVRDGLVISDSDIGCYCRPETGNHILVGSEDPDCDPREFVDADDFDREFTEQWTHQAYRMGQRIPELGIPNARRGVVDLYDVTEDWIPIYDKSCLPGFYMAIGSSGNQFKNAPVAGKMMAGLIAYCEAGTDHDEEPYRFALETIGGNLNVGFYSRLREINEDSSFSVLG